MLLEKLNKEEGLTKKELHSIIDSKCGKKIIGNIHGNFLKKPLCSSCDV